MDYEKKYKEAVCNIQKLLENGRKEGEVICAYEADFMSIFPELKESEDERIRQRIIHALHGDVLEMSEIKEAIAWLEKQGEKKPAWSEEDEKIIQWITTDIKRLINDNKKANIIADQEIKWLESLRPRSQWKPSDEQLDALHDAAVYIDKSMFPYPKGILMKLYKQLKKLREE